MISEQQVRLLKDSMAFIFNELEVELKNIHHKVRNNYKECLACMKVFAKEKDVCSNCGSEYFKVWN